MHSAYISSSGLAIARQPIQLRDTCPASFHQTRRLTHLRTRRHALNRSIARTAAGPRMSANEPQSKPTAKELAALYGGSYLGTSIGISILSYAALYAMISVGIDVRSLMNALGNWLASTPIGRPVGLDSVSDEASTAAIAYVVHKAMSPLRFPVTIAATPIVANIFSKKTT